MSTRGNPNILLIIADDLGQDVVQITGLEVNRKMEVRTYDDSGTEFVGALPNVSLLLRNGRYLGQAWAQPACSPTRASIYTGLHPWKSGIGWPSNPQLATSSVTSLPLMLPDVPDAYACGLFGKWHLGNQKGTRPTAHGWDKHVGTLGGVVPDYQFWTKDDSCDYLHTTDSSAYVTEDTVNEAADWINNLPEKRNSSPEKIPWFLTIAFHSPHDPFHTPPGGTYSLTPWNPLSDDFKFNAMAQNMDFHIGRLIGTGTAPWLTPIPREELENTVIIFIGDNGSPGPTDREDPNTAIAIQEPKTTIYEGGVRVPFIIADGQAVAQAIQAPEEEVNPRFLAADKLNTTSYHLAHVVDLYRTIAEVANSNGGSFPANMDSTSLTRFFMESGKQKPVRSFNFSQCFYTQGGEMIRLATIRNNGYKLNYDPRTSPKYQLFQYKQNKAGIGIEIPDREDDGTAKDLFRDARTGSNDVAAKNLNLLLAELQTNYQADDQGTAFENLPR